MSGPDPQGIRSSRTKLLLIFALFMLPPLLAWAAWKYLGETGVEATTNAGILVNPARPLQLAGLRQPDGTPLTDADLRGHWTFVLFAAEGCDERCQQQLYLTRQIRMAMNKDVRRVQRVLVLGRDPDPELAGRLAGEHADLRWVVRDGAADGLLQRFRGEGFDAGGEKYFLVDPLGNLMMYYDLGVPAKGTMKDLQRLLKISQIG